MGRERCSLLLAGILIVALIGSSGLSWQGRMLEIGLGAGSLPRPTAVGYSHEHSAKSSTAASVSATGNLTTDPIASLLQLEKTDSNLGLSWLQELKGGGAVCTRCCISTEKSFTDNPDALRRSGGFVTSRYISDTYPDDRVAVWPADEEALLPGLTHVVWTLKHHNALFNIAEVANAWQTWAHLRTTRVDRVILLRNASKKNYRWIYEQLRGGPSAPAPVPTVLESKACFDKVLLGTISAEHFQPWRSPYCARYTDLSKLNVPWLPGFAAFLRSRLPPPPMRLRSLDDTPRCVAVVLLRGAANGPNRERRGRNFLNSNDVMSSLRRMGFLVEGLELRNVSMVEAGAIMNTANLVVGPHGARLANIIFSRPGGQTTLVELHNWGAQKYVYEGFAAMFGIRYEPLICKTTKQCPLSPLKVPQQEIDEEARGLRATQDLCGNGKLRWSYYNSNHTARDINADIPSLERVVMEVSSRLVEEGLCHVVSELG